MTPLQFGIIAFMPLLEQMPQVAPRGDAVADHQPDTLEHARFSDPLLWVDIPNYYVTVYGPLPYLLVLVFPLSHPSVFAVDKSKTYHFFSFTVDKSETYSFRSISPKLIISFLLRSISPKLILSGR